MCEITLCTYLLMLASADSIASLVPVKVDSNTSDDHSLEGDIHRDMQIKYAYVKLDRQKDMYMLQMYRYTHICMQVNTNLWDISTALLHACIQTYMYPTSRKIVHSSLFNVTYR